MTEDDFLRSVASRTADPAPAPAPTHPARLSSHPRQKMAEDLDEASNELIITDEDAVRYSVGETFVTVENDEVGGSREEKFDLI